jgi:hypothetical protein
MLRSRLKIDKVGAYVSYFEKKDLLDKAAGLYYKCGQIKKALDICLKSKEYHLLEIISEG